MPAYRVYCVDGAGKFVCAEWIDAEGDNQAVQAARGVASESLCELWQGNRLVARVAAEPQASGG